MVTKCQYCDKQFNQYEKEDFSCQAEESCLDCFKEAEQLTAEVLQDLQTN